jgi:hypothetical protein
MGISIKPELEARLRASAAAEGLSLDAYVERLLEARESALAELEAISLEGLNSGEPVVPDAGFWESRHRLLDERLKQADAR